MTDAGNWLAAVHALGSAQHQPTLSELVASFPDDQDILEFIAAELWQRAESRAEQVGGADDDVLARQAWAAALRMAGPVPALRPRGRADDQPDRPVLPGRTQAALADRQLRRVRGSAGAVRRGRAGVDAARRRPARGGEPRAGAGAGGLGGDQPGRRAGAGDRVRGARRLRRPPRHCSTSSTPGGATASPTSTSRTGRAGSRR